MMELITKDTNYEMTLDLVRIKLKKHLVIGVNIKSLEKTTPFVVKIRT